MTYHTSRKTQSTCPSPRLFKTHNTTWRTQSHEDLFVATTRVRQMGQTTSQDSLSKQTWAAVEARLPEDLRRQHRLNQLEDLWSTPRIALIPHMRVQVSIVLVPPTLLMERVSCCAFRMPRRLQTLPELCQICSPSLQAPYTRHQLTTCQSRGRLHLQRMWKRRESWNHHRQQNTHQHCNLQQQILQSRLRRYRRR